MIRVYERTFSIGGFMGIGSSVVQHDMQPIAVYLSQVIIYGNWTK